MDVTKWIHHFRVHIPLTNHGCKKMDPPFSCPYPPSLTMDVNKWIHYFRVHIPLTNHGCKKTDPDFLKTSFSPGFGFKALEVFSKMFPLTQSSRLTSAFVKFQSNCRVIVTFFSIIYFGELLPRQTNSNRLTIFHFWRPQKDNLHVHVLFGSPSSFRVTRIQICPPARPFDFSELDK